MIWWPTLKNACWILPLPSELKPALLQIPVCYWFSPFFSNRVCCSGLLGRLLWLVDELTFWLSSQTYTQHHAEDMPFILGWSVASVVFHWAHRSHKSQICILHPNFYAIYCKCSLGRWEILGLNMPRWICWVAYSSNKEWYPSVYVAQKCNLN